MQTLKHAVLGMALCAAAACQAAPAFRGSADGCVALVKKAKAYLAAQGAAKAYAEFNNPSGQFVVGDMYIGAVDLQGRYLAHGNNYKLVGKDLSQLRDPNGKMIVKEMIAVASSKEGAGWVDYQWPNPATEKMEMKSTYVERAGDIFLGCGIYK